MIIFDASTSCSVTIHVPHKLPAVCFCSFQKAAALHNCRVSCQAISLWVTPTGRGITRVPPVLISMPWQLQQTILLGSIFLHLISGEICDQHARDKMRTQFRDCAAELSYEFQDTKNTFPGEVYVQVRRKKVQ